MRLNQVCRGITSTEAVFIIGEQLRFIFFGLECALHVEFNPDETERVFLDAGAAAERLVDSRAKQYTFWASPDLCVLGQVDDHEPETVRLIVESDRSVEPSLFAIGERAKYQVFRMRRRQEAQPSE